MASLSGSSTFILSNAFLHIAFSSSRFAFIWEEGKGVLSLYIFDTAGLKDLNGWESRWMGCRSTLSNCC